MYVIIGLATSFRYILEKYLWYYNRTQKSDNMWDDVDHDFVNLCFRIY